MLSNTVIFIFSDDSIYGFLPKVLDSRVTLIGMHWDWSQCNVLVSISFMMMLLLLNVEIKSLSRPAVPYELLAMPLIFGDATLRHSPTLYEITQSHIKT